MKNMGRQVFTCLPRLIYPGKNCYIYIFAALLTFQFAEFFDKQKKVSVFIENCLDKIYKKE